jgi:hypothetical protein
VPFQIQARFSETINWIHILIYTPDNTFSTVMIPRVYLKLLQSGGDPNMLISSPESPLSISILSDFTSLLLRSLLHYEKFYFSSWPPSVCFICSCTFNVPGTMGQWRRPSRNLCAYPSQQLTRDKRLHERYQMQCGDKTCRYTLHSSRSVPLPHCLFSISNLYCQPVEM